MLISQLYTLNISFFKPMIYIYHQMMQNQGGGGRGRPCKFGATCNKFKQGICTFLHDNNGGSSFQGPYQPKSRPQYNNNPNDYNYQGGGGRGGYDQPSGYRNPRDNNFQNQPYENNYSQGGNTGGRGGRGSSSYNQHNQPRDNYPNKQQSVIHTNQFCRFFQSGDCTKPGCKKIHGFTKGDSLKRVLKTSEAPNHPQSRLTKLEINGKVFFCLRQNISILIFEMDQNSQIITKFTFNIDIAEPLTYFSSSDKYIYFGYINKNTTFINIGYIDVVDQKKIMVENAHKTSVTGMIHIQVNNYEFLMSASQDGTIKVWKQENNQLVLENEGTQSIATHINNTQKAKILFLTKQTLEGKQIISAGTNNNRLFRWVTSNLEFNQTVLPETYNQILSIKHCVFNGNVIGLIICWASNPNKTAIIGVTLNGDQQLILTQEQPSNLRYNYHLLQILGDLIFISNFTGVITVYKLLNLQQKVGCIFHSNCLTGLTSLSHKTKTNIQIMNLFVLQKRQGEKEGSFEVYIYS